MYRRTRHHSILTCIVIMIISIFVGICVYNHDIDNYASQNNSNKSVKTTVVNTPTNKNIARKTNRNNAKSVKSLNPDNSNWDMNINTEELKGVTIHNLKFQYNKAKKNGYIIHILGHHMLVGMIEPGSQQKVDQRFFFHLSSVSGNVYHFTCNELMIGNAFVNLNTDQVFNAKNKKSVLKEAQRLKPGLNETELIKK